MTDKLEITVDLTKLEIGDLALMQTAEDQKVSPEMVDMLDRVVVGGCRHMPITRLNDVMKAINEALEDEANPLSQTGNASKISSPRTSGRKPTRRH